MIKRKSLTVLMTVAILILAVIAPLFGVINLTASADTAATVKVEDGFVYTDETNTEISGFELPESVTGDFEIIIPAGVRTIGEGAFEFLENLKGVTLNQGLETIGAEAFALTSISSVSIPKSVTRISDSAFESCASLADISFESGRTEPLTIASRAFADCRNQNFSLLRLPDNTTVGQYAFDGCTALRWVYVGGNCTFRSTSGDSDPTAAFFPTNTAVTIIFPSKDEYNKMLDWQEETFRQKHLNSATYIIKVKCYIGSSTEPVVYERLTGKSFNYVPNAVSGEWNTDTAYASLPVQDAAYSATTWYREKTFETAVDYAGVNSLLATESEINLYCHETISVPVFPAEPVSWVYSREISYDIGSAADVLKAFGCEKEYTENQLSALDLTVTFADENGKPKDTPAAINSNGAYNVKISLKPEYGSWSQDITSSITVSINTSGFTIVMIVLLCIGVVAVVMTASTAIIRKKIQQRSKKKQLTQSEIIEKYKSVGGETTLK